MIPRQLGPISRIPYLRAALSVASAIESLPWPSPALMISAPAVPRIPASSTDSGHLLRWRRNHDEFGNEWQLIEPRHCGIAVDLRMARIHYTEFPANLASRTLRRMARPTDPCRELAPTSATERGNSTFFSR